jgi:Zn2+/Cd2+-exporting ATPase
MLQVLSTREMLQGAINCSDCRTQLEQKLQSMTGVTSVSVTERSIEIDASDSLETLKTEIKRIAGGISSHHDHASFLVEGMDCADCARKVETAVTRMPGVTSSKVNFSTQKLTVGFDAGKTKLDDFARIIEPLGYKVRAIPSTSNSKAKFSVTKSEINLLEKPEEIHEDSHKHEAEHAHDHGDSSETDKPWFQSRQGQLVLSSGGLLVLAYLLGLFAPGLAVYGYIAATLVGVFPLVKKALASMRVGDFFSINFLVSIAAIGAIIIGEAPEGAVVVFFFAIGELLEGIAAGRARAGIKSLAALTPKTAQLIHGVHTHEVSAASLKIGQVVRINAGARVPCDGTILAGSSSLDDSPVTGESVPVNKTVNDTVFAGSINTDGVLEVRVDKSSDDNTISRIIHMVEEAESGKAPTARFVERFSRSYTPFVVLAAALVILVPPLLFGGAWHDWLYKGLSILLIGCPCALVLSVPAAITSGISSGARRGLLIKGGAALEEFATLDTIAFDKTGTLTIGQPKVTDVIALNGQENELLRLAASVETGSSHPLAKAITDKAKDLKLELETVTDAKAIQGKAVVANLGARVLAVGSPRYANEISTLSTEVSTQIGALENAGKTVVVLLENSTPCGLIAIRDEPRTDAKEAILELKSLGISSLMLTGDNARTGKAIADALELDVRAELLPEDKLKLIGEMKKTHKIGMVGDGINDAPALALADVGVAMGSGTDVALETADAALLKNSVRGVSELVQLSRAVMGNIRQNIIFALGLKAVFLVTTLLGLTNLWMAILSDTGATALVTANALRLLTFKPRIP